VRLEGLGQLKNQMTIGKRTLDLRACSIVPQLRAPLYENIERKALTVYRFVSKWDPCNNGMVRAQILERGDV
jgi:hypothetical protein